MKQILFYCICCLLNFDLILSLNLNYYYNNNKNLVPYFAIKYVRGYNQLSMDEKNEILQEGNLGLLKAAEKFDESKGFKFSTYARFWINRYMFNYYEKISKVKNNEYNNNDLIYKKLNNNNNSRRSNIDIIFDSFNELEFEGRNLLKKRFIKKKSIKTLSKEYNCSKAKIKYQINSNLFIIKKKYLY